MADQVHEDHRKKKTIKQIKNKSAVRVSSLAVLGFH